MKRIYSLEGLRTIAFLIVFIAHTSTTSISGACGVSIFFVLSGFLMSYNYFGDSEKKNQIIQQNNIIDALKFAINKIKKLYLLHVIMTIACLPFELYAARLKSIAIWYLFRNLLLNLTFLQAWVPVKSVYFSFNGVSWYLSALIFCYFIFPFFYALCVKTKQNTRVILLICFICMMLGMGAASVNFPLFSDWFTSVCPFFRLLDFIVGCSLGRAYINHKSRNFSDKKDKMMITILEIVSIIVVVLGLVLHAFYGGAWWSEDVLFLPGSCLMVYVLSLDSGYISYFIKNKVFLFMGSISAYTYLFHQVIIRYIQVFDVSGGVLIVMSLSLTIICGYFWMKRSHFITRFVCKRKD